MKVYVVMGNDYPDAVFQAEAAAEKYVGERTISEKAAASKPDMFHRRIYYRYYEFELQGAAP